MAIPAFTPPSLFGIEVEDELGVGVPVTVSAPFPEIAVEDSVFPDEVVRAVDALEPLSAGFEACCSIPEFVVGVGVAVACTRLDRHCPPSPPVQYIPGQFGCPGGNEPLQTALPLSVQVVACINC